MEFQANIDELFQAQSHIYKHMYHYMESMSLKCAVHLGIPDIIQKHKNPVTLLDLASQLHIPSSKTNSLERVMRILVHSGFFNTTKLNKNQEEEGYVLTPSSALLLKDSNPTLVQTMLDPALVSPCFSLSEWFRSKELTPFETYHGKSFWEYGNDNPEFMNSLNDMMASDSKFTSLIVKEHKEIFQGFSTLVDVGGGTGTLARTISDSYPHIQCTVLDLPQVVANLPGTKNLKFVAGDMFHSVPCADAVLIKSVLHNWSDAACVKILKRCREAIGSSEEGGKLIIIEMVIRNDKKDENGVAETKFFLDLEMMLLSCGKERNEQEWKKLFMEAGFSHYKITATSGLNSIIEVYP
ncbi:trans-resveratrol di-O-methyltransferase-like [Euphorbia lathyris]|uniref:trans-resveratrol di-O-methyltransferase-like n=1 Tax=Euphorbia lathyris TaxID=212925 RepID=UPI00331396AA